MRSSPRPITVRMAVMQLAGAASVDQRTVFRWLDGRPLRLLALERLVAASRLPHVRKAIDAAGLALPVSRVA